MTKIKIVTDSSVTIEPELVKQLDITVVPLSVMIDNVVYSDADLKEEGKFLQLMQEAKNLPKTSQPPVGVFAEVFEELSKDGSQILAIHMSHALSGTVEAARQGASLSTADVTVIDSSFTDQALKFQVVEAAKLAQAGKDMEEILTRVEAVKNNTELYIGVSTLENLVKGGRIGRVTGLLSSLLNIRVVMQMKDHELQPIVKGRGAKTFKKWLDELTTTLSERSVAEIGISYSGGADWAKEMKESLQAYVEKPISVLETGSIIQTHTGENAWAILVRYHS
jgi:degV domain-containing protein spr1019